MRRILLALAVLAGVAGTAFAQGTPGSAIVTAACGTTPSTYTPGQNKALLQDPNGLGCENINSSALPAGAATSALQSTVQSAPGTPASTANTIQGNASAVPVPVAQAASATVGISTQSCTVACASTIISGAHALYSISGSATVTGYILVYDATSCAANGTVTPKKAFAYPVANYPIGISWGAIPMINATGIAVCFSSTGPYTATASTTAFLSADFK
jgi:hypothetical protein